MPLELGLVFIVTAILFICFSLKKVGKGQSLVVFKNGRAVKAIERNGLTLLLPFVQTAKLIDVRKTSLAIPAVYSDIDSRTP
ncbi:SPFH domain-containing protein, partial [Streptomyces scabiei]|uniref:SPFH domain-containing protein n=1 Tax=Streptomyces scabiei TaxID=1930 RepID=UPI0038F7A709